MQPALELGGAFVGVGVGSGADMPQAEFLAGRAEGDGTVATAVVGHDALNADTQAGVAGDGGCLALIGPDFGKGHPGVVVDAHMDAFPANTPGVLASIPADAVADTLDPAELLDFEVEQLAGRGAFVAHDRWERRHGLPGHRAQQPAQGRFRQARALGDLGIDQALVPPLEGMLPLVGQNPLGAVRRARGTLLQATGAFGAVTFDPSALP
jgi:hypothetical protein